MSAAAAGKRKRPDTAACEKPTRVALANPVQIKEEAVVRGEYCDDGAPATDAAFAGASVHDNAQDEVPDLWFCCEDEGSPFAESDEEFMPFA